MDTLETLLKVAQSRLDEISREAGAAAERMATLNARLIALSEEHTRAGDTGGDLAVLIAAGNFRVRQRDERDAIGREIEEQRVVVEGLRAKLTLAFQERSKFEQLIAQANLREARAEAALEQKQLDEAALRAVARRG